MEKRDSSTEASLNADLFLARRAARADAAAWDEIVDLYGERIYNLAYRFAGRSGEAEDLTQEIFLKLYRQLDRYRGEVPLVAWALRLSRNLCIDHYRQTQVRHRAQTVPEELLLSIPGSEDSQTLARERENQKLVYRALAAMPESQAAVVMLRDLQDLSYEEIAAFYEVPVGTIKSRLNRARRQLVKVLEELLSATGERAGGNPVGQVSSC